MGPSKTANHAYGTFQMRSQCFWHHFAYTVNWSEGLDRGAPQPRGPPAVCSLRTALLQYTTGYGFD